MTQGCKGPWQDVYESFFNNIHTGLLQGIRRTWVQLAGSLTVGLRRQIRNNEEERQNGFSGILKHILIWDTILRLYRASGKENGNYYLGLRATAY